MENETPPEGPKEKGVEKIENLNINIGDVIVSKSGTRRTVKEIIYSEELRDGVVKAGAEGGGKETVPLVEIPFKEIRKGLARGGWIQVIEKPGGPAGEKSPEVAETLDIYIGDVLVSVGSGNRRTIKKLDYARKAAEVEVEKAGGTFSSQTLTFEQIKEALEAGRIRIEKAPRP